MTSDLDGRIADQLRDAGQRYTSCRRRLVRVLQAAAGPLTVPEILGADTSVAPSSAYRNLGVLVEAGVVTRIVTSNEHAHFELDSSFTGHHHHLVCRSCGSVTDFTLGEQAERDLDDALERIASDARYAEADHRLDVVGICPACS